MAFLNSSLATRTKPHSSALLDAVMCSNCRDPVNENKFCSSCGFAQNSPLKCSCGWPFRETDRFCSACGLDTRAFRIEVAEPPVSAAEVNNLPEGWVEASTEEGEIYYVNETLGTSQWERPEKPIPKSPPAIPRVPHASTEREQEIKARQTKAKSVVIPADLITAKTKIIQNFADYPNQERSDGGIDLVTVSTSADASAVQPLTREQKTALSFTQLVTDKFRLVEEKGKSVIRLEPEIMGSFEAFKVREDWGCFLKCNVATSVAEGKKIWKWINSYIGVRSSSKDKPKLILELTHYMTILRTSMRDEIYCQLIKQVRGNPKPESVRSGYELLDSLLKTFPPGLESQAYLQAFIESELDKKLESKMATPLKAALASLRLLWNLGAWTLTEYSLRFYDYFLLGSGKPLDSRELLMYSRVLHQPLQKLERKLKPQALQIFDIINKGLMGSRFVGPAVTSLRQLFAEQSEVNRPKLVDECFCQLAKQMTFPPNAEWQAPTASILRNLLDTNMPTPRLGKYLRTHVFITCLSALSTPDTKTILKDCLAKLDAQESVWMQTV
jgi:hypothetical protein